MNIGTEFNQSPNKVSLREPCEAYFPKLFPAIIWVFLSAMKDRSEHYWKMSPHPDTSTNHYPFFDEDFLQ